ncbi:UdgX family uracil-DNA binding protein [Mesorhizobium sp. BAC0120]|uniref:UdgX family uracil-DNA binding protein n=1 Tax=Mesorhizobium sp. BAC0120 TaxID=3090670 RepID=UPI00298C7DC5|nr:UdgX family uracil-DNA binding protein [Mesorhizobium sp. BAC0120]MDW6024964.1 UdgX family uracil-DNA binding protein [Mesorhizobium sp. BAC0120]
MLPAQRSPLGAFVVALACETDFHGWRDAARRLAVAGIEPAHVHWQVADHKQESMFGDLQELSHAPPDARLTVPREFVERAEIAICHTDPNRFALLYRVLWRLRQEPNLLKIASDPDIRRMEALEKAVDRDIHKMRAFVRFRRIEEDGIERYLAWFEPEHFIVGRNAPFFARRFTGMLWSILTPKGSVSWDGEELSFGPPASKHDVPSEDAAESLWLTYYRSIFNPARLMVDAMQKEMPKKYWRNLPEASVIPDLIAGADKAATDMIARTPTTPSAHHAKVQAKHWPMRKDDAAVDDLPEDATLNEVREAAMGCRRCPLWRNATQTVFGEGPEAASVVFVGEQPGDQEDLAGQPFVGPAGKVFDAILDDAEIDRRKTYVTNAVKHFKFEPRGKRRIHSKPNAGEVQACRWWLDKELALIRPNLAVALGATAAQSLLGKAVPVTKMRGEVIERDDGLRVFITIHPSFILRIQDAADKEAERGRFLRDMQAVKKLMGR